MENHTKKKERNFILYFEDILSKKSRKRLLSATHLDSNPALLLTDRNGPDVSVVSLVQQNMALPSQ